MLNIDFLAEMHYASCDPAYAYYDEDEAEYAELIQYASTFEIECEDYDDTVADIRKAEDMIKRIRDDQYDVIEHLEDELEKGKSCLPRLKELCFG